MRTEVLLEIGDKLEWADPRAIGLEEKEHRLVGRVAQIGDDRCTWYVDMSPLIKEPRIGEAAHFIEGKAMVEFQRKAVLSAMKLPAVQKKEGGF